MRVSNKKRKILVVEDELSIRSILALNLRKKGYSLAEATDAAQAIDFIDKEDFDVILLDLLMPMNDGIDVLAHIAHMPHPSSARVIVITNLSEDEAKKRVGVYHVDAILTKASLDLRQVAASVAAQIARRGVKTA